MQSLLAGRLVNKRDPRPGQALLQAAGSVNRPNSIPTMHQQCTNNEPTMQLSNKADGKNRFHSWWLCLRIADFFSPSFGLVSSRQAAGFITVFLGVCFWLSVSALCPLYAPFAGFCFLLFLFCFLAQVSEDLARR